MTMTTSCHAQTSAAFRMGMALSVALVVASCGKKGQEANAPAGQVIAKVGEMDVTIHELQNEYRHLRITPDKVTEPMTREILGELVKRKVFAQRAQAAKLDREPTVLLDLIRAREQVLATVVIQRDLQAKLATIGKAEVDRYINANPAKFARRTRFDVDSLRIESSAAAQAISERVQAATTIEEIEREVAADKLQFTRSSIKLYSTDLPPELLGRISARKDSDVFALRDANSIVYFKVKGEGAEPLSGDAAANAAQAMLRAETTRAELTRQVQSGDVPITYLGTYEALMAPPKKN